MNLILQLSEDKAHAVALSPRTSRAEAYAALDMLLAEAGLIAPKAITAAVRDVITDAVAKVETARTSAMRQAMINEGAEPDSIKLHSRSNVSTEPGVMKWRDDAEKE